MRTKRLYKFYSEKWGVESLRKRQLKISTIPELNDPFELNAFSFKTREDRRAWRGIRAKLGEKTGLISFSESWSNPVIWSHYAESHKGICLGFDVSESLPEKVKYVSAKKKPPGLLEIAQDDDEEALEGFITTKYLHWKYEKEWRVLINLSAVGVKKEMHEEKALYFRGFSEEMKLAEVIIGAESEVSSQKIVEAYGSSVATKTARCAFQTFRMVEQRSEKFKK